MPITFTCACGKTLRVPDASAGKRAKCPACGAVIDIPAPPEPEPVFEIVEEPVLPPLPGKAYQKPAAAEDDSDDGGTYGLAAPERDPAPESGGGGAAPKKKLPNFRLGTDNRT